MDGNDKIQVRFFVSTETAERIKNISKKFHVKPNIAVEMAVYSLNNFGETPLEIDQRLDRIENSIAALTSAPGAEEIR